MTTAQIKKYDKYSVPQLLKKCQVLVNKYVRERDKDLGCISCTTGRVSQAGHYLSQGHHSAHRFDIEKNLFGQCTRCNLFLHGNLIGYRKGLIRRIGEEKVLMLEGMTKKAFKWDRFTVIQKIEFFKEALKPKKQPLFIQQEVEVL